MEFCVICGEHFKEGNDVVSLPSGKIGGEDGRHFVRYGHIEIHWLCFLGLIEAIKEVDDK
jgi:hypothetical protein